MGDRSKVFGIGFHKTATTSLKRALQGLGYRVTGPDARDHPDPSTTALDLCIERSRQFDAFQDNPWPLFYNEMDELHPGSRFVLTTRPSDEWISSLVTHFGAEDTPMRQWIYGVGHPLGNESLYVERYERHNREVVEYFADRPDDLLVLAITQGQGWAELCPFLEQPEPQAPFPRANTVDGRRSRARFTRRVAKKVRNLGSSRKHADGQ